MRAALIFMFEVWACIVAFNVNRAIAAELAKNENVFGLVLQFLVWGTVVLWLLVDP